MKNEITVTGEVNAKGQYGVYQMDYIKDFCSKHPNSKLIITFEVVEKESKAAMLSYFYKAIVTRYKKYRFDNGDILTKEQAKEELKDMTMFSRNRSLADLTKAEMVLFLDTIKSTLRAEFGIIIEEVRTL
jgi:hypothetical protein